MKILESYLSIKKDIMFFRHNEIKSNRKSLLFIHGLGASGLSFIEIFDYNKFDKFNIIVPDLIGYGRSSGSIDYSFDSHVERLQYLISEKKLTNITLIGHSMGGDLTTLLCQSDKSNKIEKYINIEGDITEFDQFLSAKAVEADKKYNFDNWFKNVLPNSIIFKGLENSNSSQKYYASLKFCRPEAYRKNSIELLARNNCLTGKYKSEIGQIYKSLQIPKVFCYGDESLSKETILFLKENHLKFTEFKNTGHSPMSDKPDEFYDFLYNYI